MRRMAIAVLALWALCATSSARAEEPPPAPDPGKAIADFWQGLTHPPPPKPEPPGPQNTITLNPLALRYEQLGIEYERALGPVFSIYLAPQGTYGRQGSSSALSLGGELGLRVFFLGKAPSGLWIGPALSGIYARQTSSGVTRSGFGLGVGGSAGWTLVVFQRLALSVGFAAVSRSVPDLQATGEPLPTVQLLPLPRLAFGVAF